jgi:hypothetical protein
MAKGVTVASIISTNDAFFRTYKAAFPRTALILMTADPFRFLMALPGQTGIDVSDGWGWGDEVCRATQHQARSIIGTDAFVLQNNGLTGDMTSTLKAETLAGMKAYATIGGATAWQMGFSATQDPTRMGGATPADALTKAFANGEMSKPLFIEVYNDDLDSTDPAVQQSVSKAKMTLEGT